MAIVLNHSQASGSDKLVLIGIASHDGDGGAWPSVNTLAKYANVSPRTVQRALNKLGQLGEIVIYTNDGGNRALPDYRRPNRYEITLKCPPNCDRSNKHKLVDNYNQTLFKDPLTQVSPPDAGVTPPPDAGVTPPPDARVTLTILKNHPLKPSLKVGHSPALDGICWACGQPKAVHGAKYCTDCTTRGMNNPMISCHCGDRAAVRRHPGQQFFSCPQCPESKAKEAPDHRGSTL